MSSEEPREASAPGAASQQPDGRGSAPGWSIEVSRSVGQLARSFVDGLGVLWQTVEGETARLTRHSKAAGPTTRTKERLEDLLQQLGSLVAAHAATGYGTLAESDELARLLPRLQRSLRLHRRSQRLQQILARKSAAPPRTSDAPAPVPAGAPASTRAEAGEAGEAGETLFDPTDLLGGGEPAAPAESSQERAAGSGGGSAKGRTRKEDKE